MNIINCQVRALSLLTAVIVVAICWIAGCAKKSEQEAVPEIHDTLLITHDTLSEIPTTLTDTRDGKTYKTVTIGKQTWMAKNLNYETAEGSWCYGNKPDSCNKYGRLYDWSAAMNLSSSNNSSKWDGSDFKYQGVCPSGWHLPSNAEWTALVSYVESDRGSGSGTAAMYLKSTSGWYNSGNGSDDFGFSALPGWRRGYSGSSFGNAGNGGLWWAATEGDAGGAYGRGMYYDGDDVYNCYDGKEYGFSVRCVGD